MSGKLPFGLKTAKPGSLKVKSFSIGSLKKKKKSKFQLMKEERERKKREAEAEAAAVYEDFAKHFDSAASSSSSASSGAGASKTFVLGAGVGAHTVSADSASKSPPKSDSATSAGATRRRPVSDGVKSMFSTGGASRRTGSSSSRGRNSSSSSSSGSRATHAAFSSMQSSSSASASSLTSSSSSTGQASSLPSGSSSSSASKPPSELSSLLDEIKQTRSTRKSTRNIDSFLEELKSGRPSIDAPTPQTQGGVGGGGGGGRGGPVTGYGGSHYDGDPLTTNLYVGNLAPTVTEEVLIEQFGDMGEIASVKIMWPRTPEEKARQRNCGFVSYMKREDAAFAQREMDGATLHGYEIRVGWGKAVKQSILQARRLNMLSRIKKIHADKAATMAGKKEAEEAAAEKAVVDSAMGEAATALAQAAAGVISATASQTAFKAEMPEGAPKVEVEYPKCSKTQEIIDLVADYCARDGDAFERVLLEREASNPKFQFLRDSSSPDHTYYRWRVYSLAMGDRLATYRADPFQMFQGGPWWIPPTLPDDSDSDDSDSDNGNGNGSGSDGSGKARNAGTVKVEGSTGATVKVEARTDERRAKRSRSRSPAGQGRDPSSDGKRRDGRRSRSRSRSRERGGNEEGKRGRFRDGGGGVRERDRSRERSRERERDRDRDRDKRDRDRDRDRSRGGRDRDRSRDRDRDRDRDRSRRARRARERDRVSSAAVMIGGAMVGGGFVGREREGRSRAERERRREEAEKSGQAPLSGRALEREREKRRRREVKLTDEQFDEFRRILQKLDLRRTSVEKAMGFVLDAAEASAEIVQVLGDALTLSETPAPKKVARLYLVSDTLHNSSAAVRNASSYRTLFEAQLPKIFTSLGESYRNLTSRLAAAAMRKKVLSVLEVWDDWSLYPPLFIVGLEMTFLGSRSDLAAIRASLDDLDEATVDVEDLKKKCRQAGVVDAGSAKDLLIRLHCVNEYTQLKALGMQAKGRGGGGGGAGVRGGAASGSNALLLKAGVNSLLGHTALSNQRSSSRDASPAVDIDGEDLDGEDLDGEDLDGEDLDGEDLDGEDLDGEDLDGEDLDGEDL